MNQEFKPKPPEELVVFSGDAKKVKEHLASIWSRLDMDQMVDLYEKLILFLKDLETRHSDYHDRAVMHAVIGSGLLHSKSPNVTMDDFEGDDSVFKFLSDREKEYLG